MYKKHLCSSLLLLLIACNQNKQHDTPAASDNAVVDSTEPANNIETAMPAGPVVNTMMTDEYVKSITKLVYLWAWPLVSVHNRVAAFAKLKEPMYGQHQKIHSPCT